jgi:hypothetical protein
MKKLIQVCSMLCLVFVFAAVSAKAQTVKQYSAEIPFDFNIAQKSYQAGSYVIKISKLSLSNVALSLEDKDKNILQTVFIRGNGEAFKNEEKLVFTRDGEQRVLSQMVTHENEFKIPAPNYMKRNLKAKGKPEAKTDVVAVASN